MTDAYHTFLETKAPSAPPIGFDVDPRKLPAALKPFQRDISSWALKRGRAALFEGTGLGKTVQELTWAQAVREETRRPVLVFTPLAVAEQTVIEAQKFDIDGVEYAAEQDESNAPIVVTNYDRAHLFDLSRFGGVVFDESSIFKSHDGKTRADLTARSADVPYILPATATPAPNDWTEIGQHAELLGVMSAKEMLAMYFVHDGANRADGLGDGWRLKRHAERDFWAWMASWSVMIRSPADLGYDEPGYVLPPLNKHQITVSVPYEPGGGTLFPMAASTLQERIAARKQSLPQRVAACIELVLYGSIDPCRTIGSNISASGTLGTKNESKSTGELTPKSATSVVASDTPQIQSTPQPVERAPENAVQQQGGMLGSAPSTESTSPNTSASSKRKTGGAPSAGGDLERSASDDGSPLTTATTPASSGVSSAKTATKASASSATVTTRSNGRRNTSLSAVSEPWLVWCHRNDEQDALAQAFGDLAFSVYGSMHPDDKVRAVRRWLAGERPIMISKPSILGWGLNFQHCRKMVFVGLNDSFEEVYQAVRRCWRFGQTEAVDAYMIASELEGAVVANQDRKERDFERMQAAMAEHMRDLTTAAVRGGRVQASTFNPTRPMELPSWMAA